MSETVTSTPKGTFYLMKSATGTDNVTPITESVHRITVVLNDDKDGTTHTSTLDARYISAIAKTNVPADAARRMERVTKKQPPKQVTIQVFLNAQTFDNNNGKGKRHKLNGAEQITQSFSPKAGAGRIFIGFRTSQTTGLAAHISAPFVPTVEREAMDLQDQALRVFNTELLELAGILMRLTLEDTMYSVIDVEWKRTAVEREKLEKQLEAQVAAEKKKKKGKLIKEAEEVKKKEVELVDTDDDDATITTVSSSKSGFLGFARFMAKGVKKKIVSVVNTVEELVAENIIDDTAEYLNPPELLPLMAEEQQAVVLMRSFCPQQSTPDPLVGTCIAQGFARCLSDKAPPVLTRSGVIRGNEARLPHNGIESFVHDNVVRSIVYQNAEEYHTVIAPCIELHVEDLVNALYSNILQVDKLVFLIKWYTKYARADPRNAASYTLLIKESVRFYYDNSNSETGRGNGCAAGTKHLEGDGPEKTLPVTALKDLLFYIEKGSLLENNNKEVQIPLPESVLPPALQERIGGASVLSDFALEKWFAPLPIEIWANYISHHSCMVDGLSKDSRLRYEVLSIFCKEYSRRAWSERTTFGGFLASILSGNRCIPFETGTSTAAVAEDGGMSNSNNNPMAIVADKPSELYLYSAELGAFSGIGTFRKVCASLKDVYGVGEDFLLALGVRKSVSIDFLFASLDTLKWSNDPKPLIEYLRNATLSSADLSKLSKSKYLPAENNNNGDGNDGTRTYAPSELYLPNLELRVFPFVRTLRWPSESEVSERSQNGQFLVGKLGMKTIPPLNDVMKFLISDNKDVLDDKTRLNCLDFVADRLGPHGVYHDIYSRLSFAVKKRCCILPCVVHVPLEEHAEQSTRTELHSPVTCYSDRSCAVMGFPVIDPKLIGNDRAKLYGSLFQCATEPGINDLLYQLSHLVAKAKSHQQQQQASTADQQKELADRIESGFTLIFKYLSHRSSDFSYSSLNSLKRQQFIPCRSNNKKMKDGTTPTIEWFRPDQVFFRSSEQRSTSEQSQTGEGQTGDGSNNSKKHTIITEELFHVVDFSPFLATAGVKQEATTSDLFQLILADPKQVLHILGSEAKYRSLLRRIASDPPFTYVTPKIAGTPFLLAYTVSTKKADPNTTNTEGGEGGDETTATTYELAKASDIYIVDNSFFGRMFSSVVKRAPPESDLEDFYSLLGSRFISQSVGRRFEVAGRPRSDTSLTNALKERILERSPLLVSPSITTRPLVANASTLLTGNRFTLCEASALMAVYSLEGISRRNRTTCFSKTNNSITKGGAKNIIYVVDDFDWFDVGYAVGDLILKRCQLEDAFFISSLLEAPVEQLRARGFPIDRILKPKPPTPPPSPPPPVVAPPPPAPTYATLPEQQDSKSKQPPQAQATTGAPNSSTAESAAAAAAAAKSNGSYRHPEGAGDHSSTSSSQEEDIRSSNDNNNASATASAAAGLSEEEGFQEIIKQMYPDADDEWIKNQLTGDGSTRPSLENVRALAEEMATGKYPRCSKGGADDSSTVASSSTGHDHHSDDSPSKKKNKGLLRKKLGRALHGWRSSAQSSIGGVASPQPPPVSNPLGGGSMAGPATHQQQESTDPVPAVTDAQSQSHLEKMLERTLDASTSVNAGGVNSPDDTKLTSTIPEGLDRGDTCEVIPGQALKPFVGKDGSSKTRNGIRIFSSLRDGGPESEEFLKQNPVVIEKFAHVLEGLCSSVYGLKLSSIAIFYQAVGGTIAFNSNRAIYCNLRFFYALFYLQNKSDSNDCYSYWFVTLAHELAHNLVSAHNKEHGFYTESYATHYLPKLLPLLKE